MPKKSVLADGILFSQIEARLLFALASKKDHVVIHEDLHRLVWPRVDDEYSLANRLKVHISNINTKLTKAGNGQVIVSVRGVGYKLTDRVREDQRSA